MKIGKKFNQLTPSAYKHYIDNRKKYTDFNTLGLYRSILENDKLHLDEKIKIRDYANLTFGKTFDFYQLKDPITYFKLISLGKELTIAGENQLWRDIKRKQQQILQEKRIKHRNFGCYSKHNCGIDSCPMNGMMIRQGSWFAEHHLYFESDKNTYSKKEKSIRHRKDRKQKYKLIIEAQE